MSFPCFPEIIAIWDAVSNYILEELMRDKVGQGSWVPQPHGSTQPARLLHSSFLASRERNPVQL